MAENQTKVNPKHEIRNSKQWLNFKFFSNFDIRISDLPKSVILVVGLGNPGKQFANTPHNLGFMAIDKFQKEQGFPDFKLSKKCKALIAEGTIGEEKVILAKPQTYMNKSGEAVRKIFNFQFDSEAVILRAMPEGSRSSCADKGIPRFARNDNPWLSFSNLIVVHDDLALPLGKIKICHNRGSAGHKGVESIIKELGTKDFARVRIGTKPISNLKSQISNLHLKNKILKELVLKKFGAEEKKLVKKSLQTASTALKMIIANGIEKTMTQFNQQ